MTRELVRRAPAPPDVDAAPPAATRAGTRAPVALSRAATRIPVALVGSTLVLGVVAPEALSAAGPALLAAAVAVGLPHGAADHLLPLWSGLTIRRTRYVALLVAYAAAAAAALVAVFMQPWVVLALLALSALHFGCGEVAVATWRSGVRPSVIRATLAVGAVGATIVAAPLALHPEITDPLLAALHRTLPGMVPQWLRLGLLGAGLVGGCLAALLAWRERDPLAAVEMLLLLALLVVVPPFAAFAVFFGGWHAWRHTLRVVDEHPGNANVSTPDDVRSAVRRFMRMTAPTTLAAGAVLAALVWVARSGAAATAIAVLIALTVPHAIVVGWLDVRLARGVGASS